MRDPNFNMEPNQNGQPTAASGSTAKDSRRSQNRAVRVTFGPDTDTHILPRGRDASPTPLASHHRSFTTIETQRPDRPDRSPTPVRPSSSSGENTNTPVGTETPPGRPHIRLTNGGRPAALQRARSDYGPRSGLDIVSSAEDDDFAMRHGWQEEYTSSEYLKILHSVRRNMTSTF
jgi:regulator-associated protein of mTOR